MSNRDQNLVLLTGTVSKDVTTNKTQKGLSIANIPVSTKVVRQNGTEIVTYHTILCFGELADLAATFKVGNRIHCSGSIQKESWEKEGVKQYTTKVKATHLILSSREAEDQPQATNSGGNSSGNFPLGETSNKAGFPFSYKRYGIRFEKPGAGDNGCSPPVEHKGVFVTCRWEDPSDASYGGTVYAMKDGSEQWDEIDKIPSSVDLPF